MPQIKRMTSDQKQDNSLTERIAELRRELLKYPSTGLEADKAFFDWLSGEEDVPDVPPTPGT